MYARHIQDVTDTMLSSLDFAIAYLEGIVIISKSREQHRESVYNVFSRIQDFRFKIKEGKCDVFMEEIKYFWKIININGRRPEPKMAKAIKNVPVPRNITELHIFGVWQLLPNINDQYARPPASTERATKKYRLWKWTTERRAVLDKIKITLPSDTFLTFYEPKLDIIDASDASSYSIGTRNLHKMTDGSINQLHTLQVLCREQNSITHKSKKKLLQSSMQVQSSIDITRKILF